MTVVHIGHKSYFPVHDFEVELLNLSYLHKLYIMFEATYLMTVLIPSLSILIFPFFIRS